MAKTNRQYMLWQYDPKADLEKEIQRALDYFAKKYGRPAEVLEHSKSVEIKTQKVETKATNLGLNLFMIG